ncbi:Octanoate-(acyl-carrier-protein)-protein-N-octan oyltransferase [Methylophaga frappieri]|uniref:Octanoyltransferase n=1 Tax=Methylophaga frappieri (strain ATCC BAA-2434 / DSM 25690 / JAM7) TaxID=754477 RepID=I1YHD0_METFJ|nr:lipoyl(octanoyl) transferase LipB [Methylophaga frappieri]AFJ02323.1 Octanoate-(acyl-carrier-protein)-protein-N-octan oyltransferase [Methylophaga frappieri]
MIVKDLGKQPYLPIWQAMQAFTQQRDANTEDEIWLLEHEPVFTLGRNSKPEHLLETGDIPVVQTDRGGQVTYHGPGQVIAYPLIDIRRLQISVRQLVQTLENSIIGILSARNIEAHARRDAPGVYVEQGKIAALGLRVRAGACYHGISFNVDMDLQPFSRINPCGYADMPVTDCRRLHAELDINEAKTALAEALSQQLRKETT